MASRLLGGVAMTVLALSAPALAEEPIGARADEIMNLVIQDCGSCHGLTMKGGLGPALLPEKLVGKDVADLSDTIMNGVPGTPMPPWKSELSQAEANWIAERLKEGLKP